MSEVFDVDEIKDVVGEEDNDEINAPEEEEAEQVQRLPTPDAPTLSEILDHRVTHVPFRAWCPDCVDGCGREFANRARAVVCLRCRSMIASSATKATF